MASHTNCRAVDAEAVQVSLQLLRGDQVLLRHPALLAQGDVEFGQQDGAAGRDGRCSHVQHAAPTHAACRQGEGAEDKVIA
jgi:hypothetical protein